MPKCLKHSYLFSFARTCIAVIPNFHPFFIRYGNHPLIFHLSFVIVRSLCLPTMPPLITLTQSSPHTTDTNPIKANQPSHLVNETPENPQKLFSMIPLRISVSHHLVSYLTFFIPRYRSFEFFLASLCVCKLLLHM